MAEHYTINYRSENTYENTVNEAYWQYMVTPQNNETQELISADYHTSVLSSIEKSIDGFGFDTVRVHCKNPFKSIVFEAVFKVKKLEEPALLAGSHFNSMDVYETLNSLHFKVDFESYLSSTSLTTLPEDFKAFYLFDKTKGVLENIEALNTWVYTFITFKAGVTTIETSLSDVVKNRQGVCQDFTHLFCAIARRNKVPARYVSGYLHQGNGFFGDSQMHAWVEIYDVNLGWIAFDPTNNLRVNQNHIKVSHGRDYNDCSPLKGVFYAVGKNTTKHSVAVTSQQ